MVTFPKLASNIRSRREDMERSMAWIAKKAGISKTYLWELEQDTKGKKCPSVQVIWSLAKVYGCSIEELVS